MKKVNIYEENERFLKENFIYFTINIYQVKVYVIPKTYKYKVL